MYLVMHALVEDVAVPLLSIAMHLHFIVVVW